MQRVESTVPATSAWEEGRLAMLERSGLLDSSLEPAFDRWTAGLRRVTGAAAAAISLLAGDRVLVKSVCTDAGQAPRANEIDLAESLEEHLIARTDASVSPDGSYAYHETPIDVGGQTLGLMSIADPARREWVRG